MERLAVYGTLKQGNHNHEVHLHREPIRKGNFTIPAAMYSNGRYPALVKSDPHTIYLEVYEVNNEELQAIDGLELPFGYNRFEWQIGDLTVWIYLYLGSSLDGFRAVDDGNFVKEREW